MFLRALVLTILIMCTVASTLPLSDTLAHWATRPAASRRHKGRFARRHSRAWWRRYRARMRRRRLALARRRWIAARRRRLIAARRKRGAGRPPFTARRTLPKPNVTNENRAVGPNMVAAYSGIYNDPSGQFSLLLPNGWSSRPVSANGEMKFRVYAPNGQPAGQATLSLVSASAHINVWLPARERQRMIGGVSFATLRRTVIDKMITADGWVVNDLAREIGGRRFFVVIAQTPASGDGRTPQQSWAFYFAEVNGRIYSFATNAPVEFSDQMAAGSERLLASLRTGNRSTKETSRR